MTPVRPAAGEGDDGPRALRRDRLVVFGTVGVVAVVFGFATALQAALIYQLGLEGYPVGRLTVRSLVLRSLINGLTVAVLLAGTWIARLERRRTGVYIACALGLSVVASLVRLALEMLLGVYDGQRLRAILADLGSALVVCALAFAVAAVMLALQRQQRRLATASARQKLRAAGALAALQSEEIRVRREVSEGLHGTVQQRLVLVTTRLGELADVLDAPDRGGHGRPSHADVAAELRTIRGQLDTMREVNVRQASQLLYPAGIEVGLAQAVRLMVGRLPSSIATTVRIDEAVKVADDPVTGTVTVAQRLLLLRVLEEGITNALRHGHASALTLTLSREGDAVVLTVDDDGEGPPDPAPALGGLSFLDDRVDAVGGTLDLGRGPLGGARLSGRLPVRSATAASASSPADPEGGDRGDDAATAREGAGRRRR